MLNKIKTIKINEFRDNKNLTKNKQTITFSDPTKVYIPLFDSGVNFEPVVKIGDYVKIGQLVALSKEKFELFSHSSISGIVKSLESKMWTNSGKLVKCIEIENDYKGDIYLDSENNDYTKEEFVEKIKKYGIVGMGGSGFPTYVKYSGKELDYLIVNACECEPFITCDYRSILEFTFKIVNGIHCILNAIEGKKAYIALKRKNKEIIKRLESCIDDKIEIVPVEDEYPTGWERYLVYKIFKRKYDKLPSEINCVVNNVFTIISIYDCVKLCKPLIERIVTFTGNELEEPINVYCKIGTPIKEVIEYIKGYKNKFQKNVLTLGGPMTGVSVPSENAVVTKNLSCILINKYLNEKEKTCIGCGRCANVCPSKLTPTEILKYYKLKNNKELISLNVLNCIQCGLCSYVCPSRIELTYYMNNSKKMVRK